MVGVKRSSSAPSRLGLPHSGLTGTVEAAGQTLRWLGRDSAGRSAPRLPTKHANDAGRSAHRGTLQRLGKGSTSCEVGRPRGTPPYTLARPTLTHCATACKHIQRRCGVWIRGKRRLQGAQARSSAQRCGLLGTNGKRSSLLSHSASMNFTNHLRMSRIRRRWCEMLANHVVADALASV